MAAGTLQLSPKIQELIQDAKDFISQDNIEWKPFALDGFEASKAYSKVIICRELS